MPTRRTRALAAALLVAVAASQALGLARIACPPSVAAIDTLDGAPAAPSSGLDVVLPMESPRFGPQRAPRPHRAALAMEGREKCGQEALDRRRSSANFAVRVALIRRIEGTFSNLSGHIRHDRLRGVFAVAVELDTRVLQMANPAHVAWAQSDEFFDSARHPIIRFEADNLPQQLLQDGGELNGQLTLRGIRHRVRFMVQPATCARSGIDCAVMASGRVRRADFGMDAKRWIVSDRVQIQLQLLLQTHSPP